MKKINYKRHLTGLLCAVLTLLLSSYYTLTQQNTANFEESNSAPVNKLKDNSSLNQSNLYRPQPETTGQLIEQEMEGGIGLPPSAFAWERRLKPLLRIMQKQIPFDMMLSGYIDNTTYYDTRQIRGLADNYVLILPARRNLDVCGQDINSRGQFNMVPVESRLIFDVFGPEILQAHIRGRVEGDFLGPTDEVLNRLRLRKAYLTLDWKNVNILSGKAWHPLTFPLSSPSTISFNNGIPFVPISRNAQIRLTYHRRYFSIIGAVLSQRDFPSPGPVGFNSVYARNSLTPNLHLQCIAHTDKYIFGVAADYKRLIPRIVTNKDIRTRKSISSSAAMAYTELNFDPLSVYAKITYAQNGANFGLIGGYAVHCIDPSTDKREYTNLSSISSWMELVIRTNTEYGIFIGYTKNLGASKSIIQSTINPNGQTENLVYALNPDADHAWRIAPRIRWYRIPIVLGVEVEYTETSYGDIGSLGTVINIEPAVHNFRFLFSMNYYF